jgi:hypothetical protein
MLDVAASGERLAYACDDENGDRIVAIQPLRRADDVVDQHRTRQLVAHVGPVVSVARRPSTPIGSSEISGSRVMVNRPTVIGVHRLARPKQDTGIEDPDPLRVGKDRIEVELRDFREGDA